MINSYYRLHEQDPIVFLKGLKLDWPNGEKNEEGQPFGDPKPSIISSYTWVNEWPAGH